MSDFPEKQEDKVNSLAIMVIGLATTAILWASVVALQAYFEDTEGEIAAQRATIGKADGVRGLKAKQVADLNKTTYADPSSGTLKRLAIEHAKRVVVRDAKTGGSMIPTLKRLVCPTIPAAVGKPGIDAVVLVTPPDCPQSAAAPTPAVPTEEATDPAAPTEGAPTAPAEAAAPAETAAPTAPPAGVAPTGSAPAEAAPTPPVSPAPAPGTNP